MQAWADRPRPLLLLAATIAGFGAQLFFLQNKLVFRPRPVLASTPADLQLGFSEIALSTGHGTVHGWWVEHPAPVKTILFLHGSDGNISYDLSTLRFLHGLRTNVLMIDYPGYGHSTGRPTEQGCYEAAEAAWTYLRTSRQVEPTQIVLFGRSLGAAVATYLAANRSCAGLVFQSGFTSIPDMAAALFPYLPVRPFCRTSLDSTKRIQRVTDPVLCVHSPDDQHVPIAQGRQVFAGARGPKKLVSFSGSHASTRWQSTPAVKDAWRELLEGRTQAWEYAHTAPERSPSGVER